LYNDTLLSATVKVLETLLEVIV